MASASQFKVQGSSIIAICDHIQQRLSSLATTSITVEDREDINKCVQSIRSRTATKHWSPLSAQDLQSRAHDLTALVPTLTDSKIQGLIRSVISKLNDEIAKKPAVSVDPPLPSPPPMTLVDKCITTLTTVMQRLIDPKQQGNLQQPLNLAIAILDQDDFLLTTQDALHALENCHSLLLVYEQGQLIPRACAPQVQQLMVSLEACIERSKTQLRGIGSSTALSPNDRVQGITNSGGNDCFLIAFLQVLNREPLRRFLVDQLPQKVWEHLAADNLDSTAVRQTLIEETSFRNVVNQGNLNPLLDQLDPTDVLGALFDEIDEVHRPVRTPQVPPPTPPAPDAPQSKRSAWSYVTRFFQAIYEWLQWVFLKMIGYADEPVLPSEPTTPQFHYQPIVSPQRRADKAPAVRFANNPLLMQMTKHITRRLPNEAVIQEQSDRTDPMGVLPVQMHANADGKYYFPELFNGCFAEEVTQDPTEWITTHHSFQRIPPYMLMSFKRFTTEQAADNTFVPHKIGNDIENIDLTIRLPEAALCAADQALPPEQKEYSLTAFLTHRGASDKGGHYVSYRKEGDRWYFFNDGRTPVLCSEDDIREAVKQSYMVFYERNHQQ